MGENINEPEIALGYLLDHLACDCFDRPAAIELLRRELPAMMPRRRARANVFLAKVRGLGIEGMDQIIDQSS